MADTTFTQTTLNKIEAVIAQAINTPSEAVKGRIDYENGGSLDYRSLDELLTARKNIKKILDSESDINLNASKKTAFKPVGVTRCHKGNL